jgi:predicted RNase H-like nuclease/cytidine deaminase
MITKFIGVDLAWIKRNPSGVAILEGDRSGASLVQVGILYPEVSVSEFVCANATANTVVAIDAPLIIVNEKGQRSCETAIGRRFGSRDASCHTSNLGLFPNAASVALSSELAAAGFVHVDPAQPQQHGRLMAEVYPHAAMVALWNLPKVIKYKEGTKANKLIGLRVLLTHLAQLKNAEPPLLKSGVLAELSQTDLDGLAGEKLKVYEGQLDAVFCAYLAYYFWYWGWERNELFGDLSTGYIMNPKVSHLNKTGSFEEKENVEAVYTNLIRQAHALARPIRTSNDCHAGEVASIIVSASGKHYSGICVDFASGIGFCAEHAAAAEMLKSHESKIALVVAVDYKGNILPPCGRCREMMWQVDQANEKTLVILAPDKAIELQELLPYR